MTAQKQYELVYIASPDATEDQLTELQSLVEGIVTKTNGTIDKAGYVQADFNASDRIKLSPASPTVWFLCGRGTVDEDVWLTLQEDHDHLSKVIRRIKRGSIH